MFRRPTLADLYLTGAVFVCFALVTVIFGFAAGLFKFELAEPLPLARTALIALVLPALLEELVFRGPVLALAKRYGRFPVWTAGIALIAFILWHPLNAWLFLKEARAWFFDWRFLTAATGLGIVATWLAYRTKSLWPPIIFHWLAVVGWKAFLGPPAFL